MRTVRRTSAWQRTSAPELAIAVAESGSRVTGQKSCTDTEYAMHFTQHALRYFDQLYNGARRMTPRDFDAEDLVQETMLRAYGGYLSLPPGN